MTVSLRLDEDPGASAQGGGVVAEPCGGLHEAAAREHSPASSLSVGGDDRTHSPRQAP